MTIEQLQQYPLGEKGLKLIQEGLQGKNVISCFGINAKYGYVHIDPNESIGSYQTSYLPGVTPILYPLTALSQKITVYGDTFVPIDRIAIYDPSNIDYLIEQIKTGLVEYVVIQLLQKWFINYQGIEAVSPFELPENPYK